MLMVWFYVVALLIILGGVLNATLDSIRTHASKEDDYLNSKAG